MIATLATADRLFWLEDHAAEQAARPAPASPRPAPARNHLRDVSFAYPGTERAVLSYLDLTLPAGATVALVGENGSGKTTWSSCCSACTSRTRAGSRSTARR